MYKLQVVGGLYKLSKPLFLHLQNGGDKVIHLSVWESCGIFNERKNLESLSPSLTQDRHSVHASNYC